MKHQASAYIDHAITLLLLVVAAGTPLFFLNQTTEFYEMPKLAMLVIATLILFGLWIFSWILKGKVSITRTPLDIPLLALLVVVIVSTYLSTTRISAIYGNFPKVHGSAVAWATYILLYFVTVSNLKTVAKLKTFMYVLYASAVVVALISILSFFSLYLPFDFAQAVNFTPTGSSFSTVAFLLLMLPLPLLSLINANKYMPLPFAMAMSILFSVTIILVGSFTGYGALILAYVICFVISKREQVKKTLPLFLVPIILTAITFVFAYLPIGNFNKLQRLETNFPKEVQLPLTISWKISASAFRDAPFIGTGPSSYLFNFASYKPVEFNQQAFWNFSFDTAYNEFLQILGTLGLLGLLAFVGFCLVVFINGWRNLAAHTSDHDDSMHVILPAAAVSGILTIVLLAIHATTLVSIVMSLFMLAVLMVSQKSIRDKVMNLSMGIKASTSDRQFDLFPIIIFIIFLIAAAPVLYQTGNAFAADYYHRMALTQVNKNGSLTYQYLQKAESINPIIDLYRVDMAQTNFALANAIAAQKGPTKDNPTRVLSDQDKKTIQTLLSQAINEGRVSVALSPLSSRNWVVLGSIYQNITGVAQNALAFALDAYGRAIQRDPLNPALRVSVGGIYYSVKNYDMAIRFFTDAVNLKPDYANAYFNLSLALRDKGDYQNAALVAQQTVDLLAKDTTTPDYKAASQLLSDLKDKAAAASKTQANQQASNQSTASANNALQGQNVNVNGLNNPPQVTPQPTVKPNPNAKIPQISPTPEATGTPSVTPAR